MTTKEYAPLWLGRKRRGLMLKDVTDTIGQRLSIRIWCVAEYRYKKRFPYKQYLCISFLSWIVCKKSDGSLYPINPPQVRDLGQYMARYNKRSLYDWTWP